MFEIDYYDVPKSGTKPFRIGVPRHYDDEYASSLRSGPYEPQFEYLSRLVKWRTRVVDVGANLGLFSLWLAAAGAEVLAIEALPENYTSLTLSVLENGFRKVRTVHAAVSDHRGTVRLGGRNAFAGIRPDGDIEVPSLGLDDLCAAYGFMDASIVKIDIEGGEMDALRSARRFLRENGKALLLVESNAWTCSAGNQNYRELLAELERLGFHLFLFSGRLLVPWDASGFQLPLVGDYLAVRSGTPPSVKGFPIRPFTEPEISNIVRDMLACGPEHRAWAWLNRSRLPSEVLQHKDIGEALHSCEGSSDSRYLAAVETLKDHL